MKIKHFTLAAALFTTPLAAQAEESTAALLFGNDILGSAEANFANFEGALVCMAHQDSKSDAFLGTIPRAAQSQFMVRSAFDTHDDVLSSLTSGTCDLVWVPANVATAFLDTDGNAGDYQAFSLPAGDQ